MGGDVCNRERLGSAGRGEVATKAVEGEVATTKVVEEPRRVAVALGREEEDGEEVPGEEDVFGWRKRKAANEREFPNWEGFCKPTKNFNDSKFLKIWVVSEML